MGVLTDNIEYWFSEEAEGRCAVPSAICVRSALGETPRGICCFAYYSEEKISVPLLRERRDDFGALVVYWIADGDIFRAEIFISACYNVFGFAKCLSARQAKSAPPC